jgi:hypothetical protein
VFQKNCAKCHGKTGEGRHFAGPSLVSEKTTSTSADDLRAITTNGRHHLPKFAGKLTPENQHSGRSDQSCEEVSGCSSRNSSFTFYYWFFVSAWAAFAARMKDVTPSATYSFSYHRNGHPSLSSGKSG